MIRASVDGAGRTRERARPEALRMRQTRGRAARWQGERRVLFFPAIPSRDCAPGARALARPTRRSRRHATAYVEPTRSTSMTSAVSERIQHQLLPRVSKPNRYLGNALHVPRKPLDAAAEIGRASCRERV